MNILEILGKVGFDWQVALANLINFLVIFLILKYAAFKPIQRIIEKRQAKIQEGLDNAEQAKTDVMMAEQQKEALLTEARQQANTIIAESKEQASKVAEKTLAEAEQRKVEIIRDGEKKAAREFDRMQQELRGQAAELVVASVQKILDEDMDDARQKALSEKAVAMMRK